MQQVIHFEKYIDFYNANNDLMESNPLQYFFLQEMFEKVVKKEQELIKLFNITNESNRIIVLFTGECCLIYDDNYDETLIPLLSKEIEFEKFNSYQFAGSKQTIDKLFEYNHASYQMQKHRVTYKCTKVSEPFKLASGRLEMASADRMQELAKLSVGFAKDYYGITKSIEEAAQLILNGIHADSVYQWVDNKRVCAIAQTMYGQFDFPVIGHFYTHPSNRNKGYGASIIHTVTNGLLNNGHESVMLQTNALTPESNRVFEKVGYHNIGEYVLGIKHVK